MEDIDAAFHHGLNRNLSPSPRQQSTETESSPSQNTTDTVSRVTLSGLLNALDGVGAQEGRILYATTNCYEALDPALCRPGRMDLHVEFKLASKYQARELFKRFYMPVDIPQGDENDSADEDNADDSGFGSSMSSEPEDLFDTGPECSAPADHAPLIEGFDDSAEEAQIQSETVESHPFPPSAPLKSIRQLAVQFAEIIPDREFSMASLQGYLMAYKSRPCDAIRNAAAWIAIQSHGRTKRNLSGHAASGSLCDSSGDETAGKDK